MAVYFFDSSALVKAYIVEIGSAWVRDLIEPVVGNDIYVVRMTEIEITSAMIRRQRSHSLSEPEAEAGLTRFRQDLRDEFHVIEVEEALVTSAIRLVEAHGLRAYDALQLATAVETNRLRITEGIPPLTLVSADQELNAAARAEGLAVEDPNQYR